MVIWQIRCLDTGRVGKAELREKSEWRVSGVRSHGKKSQVSK